MGDTIKIKVSDYYGKPQYYPFMQNVVFDALEAAFIRGDEFANVDRGAFDGMIYDYNSALAPVQ